MIIGFTGTSHQDLNERQLNVIRELLFKYRPDGIVHGDCVHADSNFHDAFCDNYDFWTPAPRVDIRPCDVVGKRAYCSGLEKFTTVHDPKPPLERNKEIVDQSHLMIACPKEQAEVVRSGTWATIRYARRSGKPLIVVYPEPHKVGILGDAVEETWNMEKLR